MELFCSEHTNDYTRGIYNRLKKEIDNFSDQKITTCSFDEWTDFLVSKYEIQTINLYEDYIERSTGEIKISRSNPFSKYGTVYRNTMLVDGYKISFKIQYDGDYELLSLIPSPRIQKRFIVDKHVKPADDKCGYIIISLEYPKDTIKTNDNFNDLISDKFNNEFSSYKKMIQYVNDNLKRFNNTLRESIIKLLNERKQKAKDYIELHEKLNIPLELDKNAPIIAPIPLKRIERPAQVSKPKSKPVSKEYSITEKDYKHIINIIHNSGSMMEDAPKAFNSLDEENLRDIIISSLGTHYIDGVTGETFRKNGKTDILIKFESKAAFIAECKIWSGVKNLDSAKSQLFGYATWKDTKLALVIFNKANKNFTTTKGRIEEWLSKNTIKNEAIHSNVWRCKIYREDTNQEVELCVMVYDIHV